MRVGYQGSIGSNSEEAARQFSENMWKSGERIDLIPLISSRPVVAAIRNGDIDYGVMASRNVIAGPVAETSEAISKQNLILVRSVVLPIHHHLFIQPGVQITDLTIIISHEQALQQTKSKRAEYFPGLTEGVYPDTALAAKNLSLGKLGKNVGVLCRENAGRLYGLQLARRNLEDDVDNFTEFQAYQRAN